MVLKESKEYLLNIRALQEIQVEIKEKFMEIHRSNQKFQHDGKVIRNKQYN